MSISDVDICNLALSRFGQSSINDLGEASAEAYQCNLNYERARDSTLREFPWPFATQPVALALTNFTVSGWTYAYIYPSNALALRRIYDPADARNTTNKPQYRIVTDGNYQYILCDVLNANADITIRVTDPSRYDVQFIEALSYKLAAEIVIPLTSSAARKNEIYQEYARILSSAQLTSSSEDNWTDDTKKSYVKARV